MNPVTTRPSAEGRSDRFGSEPQPIGSEDPSGFERRGVSEEPLDSMSLSAFGKYSIVPSFGGEDWGFRVVTG